MLAELSSLKQKTLRTIVRTSITRGSTLLILSESSLQYTADKLSTLVIAHKKYIIYNKLKITKMQSYLIFYNKNISI